MLTASIPKKTRAERMLVWTVGVGLWAIIAFKFSDVLAGRLPGSDDLMRLQQIRDLLAGQAWWTVDQARFLTPEGGQMHWSRLPDLGPAVMIWALSPLIGPENAEIFAVSVWPLMLLSGCITSLVLVCRRLGLAPISQALAITFFGLSVSVYTFWPGRIDHHGLVVALMTLGLAAALSPRMSLRSGLIGALCIVAMVSTAIEGLPYAGALTGVFAMNWVVRGHQEGPRLAWFGAGLILCSLVFYVLDAPGISPRRAVCDAYGNVHLAGLVFGGGLLVGLGVFGGVWHRWSSRLFAGLVAASLTLAVMIGVQPDCLGDPYAEVSDLVKYGWLSVVSEARNAPTVFKTRPYEAIWFFGFILAGTCTAVLMLRSAPNKWTLARASLLGLIVIAGVATAWQLRSVNFAHILASVGAGWLVGQLAADWWSKRGAGRALMLVVGVLLASPIGWKAISTWSPKAGAKAGQEKPYRMLCTDPDVYKDFSASSQMAIFAPLDLGMSVLAHTPHTVFAGPYHRNVKGIERAISIFSKPSEDALPSLQDMGATHILYCQGLAETALYADRWPGGFADALEHNNVPAWMVPLGEEVETDGVARLYRIDLSGR